MPTTFDEPPRPGMGDQPIITGSGDDTLAGGAGNDTLDGGAGLDTARYSGGHSRYTITKTSTGYTVTDTTGSDGTDTLTNVERLQFSDAKIALDIAGNKDACFDLNGHANAGQVFRLYQAAFDRVPDQAGIEWWVGQGDAGKPLTTIAGEFFSTSPEFQDKYGSLNDHEFVDRLYVNVLHRTGETAGVSWWYDQLDRHTMTRAQVLVGFSESTENQVAVIGTIQSGIDYT